MNITDIKTASTEDILIEVQETRLAHGNYAEEQVKLEALTAELVSRGEYPATDKSGKYPATRMAVLYGALWYLYRHPHNCPNCDADLRDHENGAPFKREIGIYSRDGDRTVTWKCPDCGQMWARE